MIVHLVQLLSKMLVLCMLVEMRCKCKISLNIDKTMLDLYPTFMDQCFEYIQARINTIKTRTQIMNLVRFKKWTEQQKL